MGVEDDERCGSWVVVLTSSHDEGCEVKEDVCVWGIRWLTCVCVCRSSRRLFWRENEYREATDGGTKWFSRK